MRGQYRVVFVIFLAFIASGISQAAPKLYSKMSLVGRWETKQKVGGTDVTMLLELNKDSTLKVKVKGIVVEGNYVFTNGSMLTITTSTAGRRTTEVVEIDLNDGKLTLKSKTGSQTFTRVK